jgi:hypothetical protein
MTFDINEYAERINNFYETMEQNKEIADVKLSADKWTLKQMVSHLIDSASNNHQRFIRLQLEQKINFPAYEAKEWKDITNTKDYDFTDLINLWKLYNQYLLYIVKNINENSLDNIWKINGNELTLKFIIEDYFCGHMNWHIELYNNRIKEIKEQNQKAWI